MAAAVTPIQDLEEASKAFERVGPEIQAVDVNALSALNVDVGSAASVALGVAPRMLALREQAAQLAGFDIRCMDRLKDYAMATWFLHVNLLPPSQQAEHVPLVNQVVRLRGKLMVWAEPLVESGIFTRDALAHIKKRRGHKDAAGDVVALVNLYRSCWDRIHGMCGVTEEDLTQGDVIGPALFAALSRREQALSTPSHSSLLLRQAWTLLDRAYDQCQRVVTYLRWDEGDVAAFAPNLRRNSGPRRSKERAESTSVSAAAASETSEEDDAGSDTDNRDLVKA